MIERKAHQVLSQLDKTALTIIKPHLEIEAKYLAKNCPAFLERLQTYLENPQDDPTALRLFNVLGEAQALQRSFGLVVGLLGRLDESRLKAGEPGTDG